MGKLKLKYEDLEEHLIEQIELLQNACNAYDNGSTVEAKNIALRVRTLLHDTDKSKSLLGQLSKKSNGFYSTNTPLSAQSISSHFGLINIGLKGKDTKYYPKLDNTPFANWLDFDNWWSEVIFKDSAGNLVTRRNLIIDAANKDGGAHVDDHIPEVYYNLSKNNSLGLHIVSAEGNQDIPLAVQSSIRQIGHELLKTLIADYQKDIKVNVDLWIGGSETVIGDRPSPLPEQKKTGRNEKCPCGSNIKYKKCHGVFR